MPEATITPKALSQVTRIVAGDLEDHELDVLVKEVFTYHEWTPEMIAKGQTVKDALAEAFKAILLNVPSCPTRTRALNCLLDGRMLANAAITFNGAL